MRYDIIGDIHGCGQTLNALLRKLDYTEQEGVFRHADRQIIFLGDFIDRGPQQSEVVDLVRRMVEAGTAHAVIGNHEFNAIAYYTPDSREGGISDLDQKKIKSSMRLFWTHIEDRQRSINIQSTGSRPCLCGLTRMI